MKSSNLWTMARPSKDKQYLFDKRRQIMLALVDDGYNNQQIAVIFNVDNSRITHILRSALNPGSRPKGLKNP